LTSLIAVDAPKAGSSSARRARSFGSTLCFHGYSQTSKDDRRPPDSWSEFGGSLDRRGEALRAAARRAGDLATDGREHRHRGVGTAKIWGFATNLHCSIIGTCLSTAELRHILIKLGRQEAATASEHNLHASGVVIAGQRHDGAKLLHKALDRRHRVSINRFDRAKTAAEVRAAWKEAVQRGDIPGAYWAALSHPATNDVLLREIFADVHMLSHLVGAANRADIRRLRQLEDENAELNAKVGRQQQQLRDAVVSREATIRELRHILEERITHDRDSTA